MKYSITAYLNSVKECIDEVKPEIVSSVVDILFNAYKNRQLIFVLGNGGSASTSSHFACDLAKGTAIKGKPRVMAMSLTDNVALMTAISNDIEYSSVFKEQLTGLCNKGDVVVAISASGNSPNVIEAVNFAREQGLTTIGIYGFGGGKLGALTDRSIIFSLKEYQQIEDVQMVMTHLISLELRRRMEEDK